MMGPCERLITFITPQISVSPMAASPYTKPRRMPSGNDASNRPICCMLNSRNRVGAVCIAPAPGEDCVDGLFWCRNRVEGIRIRHISRPDHFAHEFTCIVFLPLCNNHQMPNLKSMGFGRRIEFDAAIEGEDIHGFER